MSLLYLVNIVFTIVRPALISHFGALRHQASSLLDIAECGAIFIRHLLLRLRPRFIVLDTIRHRDIIFTAAQTTALMLPCVIIFYRESLHFSFSRPVNRRGPRYDYICRFADILLTQAGFQIRIVDDYTAWLTASIFHGSTSELFNYNQFINAAANQPRLSRE